MDFMCEIDWELLIKFLALIGTLTMAIIAVSKYIHEKNRDYYLKRLSEVYAPLFSFLIKQEAYRKIYFNTETDNTPLLFAESKDGDIYTSINDFEIVINSINKGLARPKLLIVINEFSQIRNLMNYYSKNYSIKDNEIRKKIIDENYRLSIQLRNEIVDGYKACIKKLSLKDNLFDIDRYYYKKREN